MSKIYAWATDNMNPNISNSVCPNQTSFRLRELNGRFVDLVISNALLNIGACMGMLL